MRVGDGRYDDECEAIFNDVHSEERPSAVLLIVVNGTRGQGFSVSTNAPELLVKFPELLRSVAAGIEELHHGGDGHGKG